MQKQSKKISLGVLLIAIMFFIGWTSLVLCSGEPTVDMEPALVPFTLVEVDRDGPQDIFSKAYGDLNGDGLKDLVVGGNASGGGGLVWYENPGWSRHKIDSKNRFGTDVEVADVNGDGMLDVIAIRHSPDRNLVWYQNPEWTPHLISEEALHDIEIADFDENGTVEVVARYQGEFGKSGATLFLYQQESTTSWNEMNFEIPEGEGLRAADINGDGWLDIVVNETWYENTGVAFLDEETWQEHIYTDTWTHQNAFVDVGDINGDGRTDIVLSPAELEDQYYRISWFEAPANPAADPWTEHVIDDEVEAVYHFVGLADFNLNGRLEIATAEMEQGDDPDEVKLYLHPGSDKNSWRKQVLFTGGSHSMRILDVNNDGAPDLFGANWRGKEVLLWVNLKHQE